ncbi:MAG: S9 family peptidase [Bacteroidetes bacterium]|nr:MAG: S9 family peptidase [Bacteroidota bacterium]
MQNLSRYFGLLLFICTLSLPQLHAQLPPLIDREVFFGDPEITGAQLSPDGKYMSFIKPHLGIRNIWVKAIDAPFEEAKPITADTLRPVPGYFWSRDGRYILYVQDKGGNENFNIYAVDPQAAPAASSTVPPARNLTDLEGVRALIYAVPESKPDVIYVGLNERDPAWHDLYELQISSGELKLLRENTDRFTSWIFDNTDQLRLATRSADNGDTEILRVDADGFTTLHSCDVLESCYPLRFHKDNQRFYLVTNKDENLTRLTLVHTKDGSLKLVEADPENRVDFGDAFFSEVSKELVGTRYNDDKYRRYWHDEEFAQLFEFLQQELPGMSISIGSSTADEQYWLVTAYSDTDPGATYLFDRKNRKLSFQYRSRPGMPIEDLATMKPIRYKSTDGLEIPAYLTLPKGVEAKNLPLIIMPHGGPWYRDSWGYNPYHQFLANRGYAVLSPNFRGSTGYGKAFLDAGNGEWGQKMQDDLTAGVQYLIDQGIADLERVGIMGGSYGGYATLAGLTFTPDVYAAGVSIVGPSNLETLLNSIPAYWEPIRKLFYVRMGDPTTEEGLAQIKRQSPLYSAKQIKAPLMVVQGANDPRVKKAESDQIVVAMRELGLPVEYILAADEGHGFRKPINNMAFLAAAEKFLAEHLGGRYQAERSDEIAAKLDEMTVDIASVTLPESLTESSVSKEIPTVAADLQAGEHNFNVQLELGGQKIPMTTTLTITDDGNHWIVNETAQTMMGPVSDEVKLKKGSLEMISREVKQGPAHIQLTVSSDKLSGTISMNGTETPVDIDLDGALFADGGGSNQLIAQLPLAEGYTAYFRNIDLQSMQVKTFKLTVVGTEEVSVPAGTFEAMKVEIMSAEGDPGSRTLWVATDGTRRVVKSIAVIPQMNGAVVTSEMK